MATATNRDHPRARGLYRTRAPPGSHRHGHPISKEGCHSEQSEESLRARLRERKRFLAAGFLGM